VRIGIFGGDRADGPVDRLIEEAQATAAAGFASYWVPQIFGMDALTALAVIGREVPDLELGTAVVPTFPRHPIVLAQQALTVQSITGGRLTLGIGLSHQLVIEAMYGLSFDKPVRHLREYLDALLPLLAGEAADAAGETITARAALSVRGATPVRTVVAALGPQMLALAGARTDGTATWMTGPATLAGHVIPTITEAAAAAGRPAPTIGAGFPVSVNPDVAAARDEAAAVFAIYGTLPSYRAMLDREGVDGPGDIAITGDEAAVRDQVAHLAEIGVTDLIASVYGDTATREHTTALLADIVAGR